MQKNHKAIECSLCNLWVHLECEPEIDEILYGYLYKQRAGDMIDGAFEPGLEVYGCPVGLEVWVTNWLDQKLQKLQKTKEKACSVLQNDRQPLWNLLSLSFSKKMDYLASLVYPSDFASVSVSYTHLTLPTKRIV